jgi:hypothetical protein
LDKYNRRSAGAEWGRHPGGGKSEIQKNTSVKQDGGTKIVSRDQKLMLGVKKQKI